MRKTVVAVGVLSTVSLAAAALLAMRLMAAEGAVEFLTHEAIRVRIRLETLEVAGNVRPPIDPDGNPVVGR